MPPALSEDEGSQSDTDAIPFKEPKKGKTAKEDEDVIDNDEAAEEVEDEDDGPDEYVVERILSHAFEADGTLRYEIKWLGYDKKSDLTWEPEENLDGAKDALQAYFKKIGGKPQYQPKAKTPSSTRGKRKASDSAPTTPASETKTASAKGKGRGKRSKLAEEQTADAQDQIAPEEWVPPLGSWEEEVMLVDTLEQKGDGLYAYLEWSSGRKTRHQTATVRQKCPQKLIDFYERHLVFNDVSANAAAATNGADGKTQTKNEVMDSA